MSTNNSLKPIILALLKQHKTITVYQIITHLRSHQCFRELLPDDEQLTLFHENFLVMNALYLLRKDLLEDGFVLLITPLSISLSVNNTNGLTQQQLAESEPVAEYYLDWNNLGSATPDTVQDLLQAFWQRFTGEDCRRDALAVLELEVNASPQEIKKRYQQLVHTAHPDKGGNMERFIAIRKAYEILKA